MLSLSRGYRLISGLCAAVIIVAVLLCFISVNNVGNSFAFTSSNVGLGAVDIGNILLGGYGRKGVRQRSDVCSVC